VEGASVVYAPNTSKLYVFGGQSDPQTISTATQIYDPVTGQWASGAPLPAPRAGMTSGYWNGKIYLAAGTDTVRFTPQIQVWAYDPLADSWDTGLITLYQPTVGAAGGVIDGRLLLAGGANNRAEPLSALQLYDLTTQQDGYLADLPLPVYGAGGAIVNNQLWVFGGGQPFARTPGLPRLDAIAPAALPVSELYDPVTNHWRSGPPLDAARLLPGGAAVGNQVLAIGGLGDAGDLASVERAASVPLPRCPTITPTPTVTGTPPTHTPTATPTATPCDNWGSIDPWFVASHYPPPLAGNGFASDGRYLYTTTGGSPAYPRGTPEAARYDPATGTWTRLADLLTKTVYGSLTYAPNTGKLYHFGGTNETAASRLEGLSLPLTGRTPAVPAYTYDYVQVYDPATNQWSPGANMPDDRAFIRTAYAKGKIYVPGGSISIVWAPTKTLWAYDPVADHWDTSLPDLPVPLMEAAVEAINGHVYVAGGGQNSGAALNTLYDYDIAARTWYTRTPMLLGVAGAQSAVVGGRLWVMGGGDPYAAGHAPSVLPTVQIYDPLTDSWSWGPSLRTPRRLGGGAAIGNQAFLFGGYDADYNVMDILESTTFHPGPPCPPSPTPTITSSPSATPSPTATPTPCPVQFSDVPPGSTFYAFIRCLACRGIVGGYPCGGPGEPCPGSYYRPNNNVTRGQVSKIVSESAAFSDPVPSTQQTFADVPPSGTFWLWVERLAGRGIIGGYPCGGPFEPCIGPTNRPYFRPNNNVTRGQLAKIVSGAAGWTETPTGQTFEDVPPTQTFYLYVERMAVRGIISGYPCGGPFEPCVGPANRPYFRPNNNATRGQMAKIAVLPFFPTCPPPPTAEN
jgi:N-acetylneuraminic acid mutarotase